EPVDLRHRVDPVGDPVEHGPPRDRQQDLRPVLGQRVEPRRVPRGEQDRLHAATTACASEASYGAECAPCSVTIAAISAAGVTSNAGFRAGKRAVTSAGSRSSIGIPLPSGVAWSTVELGATTKNGIRWWRASTASEYVPILFAVSPLAAIRS